MARKIDDRGSIVADASDHSQESGSSPRLAASISKQIQSSLRSATIRSRIAASLTSVLPDTIVG